MPVPIARREVIEAANWSFAKSRALLAAVDNISTVWGYAYALPSNCIKPLRILGMKAVNGAGLVWPPGAYYDYDWRRFDDLFTERGSADFDVEANADGAAVQGGDGAALAGEHAPHLMIAPFVDAQQRLVRRDDFQLRRSRREVFVGEIDALFEHGRRLGGNRIAGGDAVGFGNLLIGFGHQFRPTAVVGQEQEAGARPVQAAREMERAAFGMVDQLDDRGVLGIGGGAEPARRLVKHQIDRVMLLEDLTVQLDPAEPVDPPQSARFGKSIHRHPPIG